MTNFINFFILLIMKQNIYNFDFFYYVLFSHFISIILYTTSVVVSCVFIYKSRYLKSFYLENANKNKK